MGSTKDRISLIKGWENNILAAISVHSTPKDDSEARQTPNRREKDITGYNLVLPLLWDQLFRISGWKVDKLWEKISFDSSQVLTKWGKIKLRK